jgi:hypothetical protein
MGRTNKPYQCYVCYRVYPPENLGRTLLPIPSRRGKGPVHRVVCLTCYQAICDAWPSSSWARPPVLHGF